METVPCTSKPATRTLDDGLHVVLGAGQVGSQVAEILRREGRRVRVVRRGAPGDIAPGVEVRSGDLSDLSFAKRAGEGAVVVYHCVNAPYDQWPALLGPMNTGVLHAARTSGAKLVVLDNLYSYGRSPDAPLSPDTPERPVSKKGELRRREADRLRDAQAKGEVRVTIARASDFFGPGATLSLLGDRFWKGIFAKGRAEVLGDPSLPRSYSYTPDVAEGLVTLGAAEDAFGKTWHLPVAPVESTLDFIARVARELGRPLKPSRLPTWALKAMGLFSPVIGEVAEMAYQWEQPYVVDDAAYRARFGVTATPFDVSVPATVAWGRRTFER
mgnify:CR=1 FL=1